MLGMLKHRRFRSCDKTWPQSPKSEVIRKLARESNKCALRMRLPSLGNPTAAYFSTTKLPYQIPGRIFLIRVGWLTIIVTFSIWFMFHRSLYSLYSFVFLSSVYVCIVNIDWITLKFIWGCNHVLLRVLT